MGSLHLQNQVKARIRNPQLEDLEPKLLSAMNLKIKNPLLIQSRLKICSTMSLSVRKPSSPLVKSTPKFWMLWVVMLSTALALPFLARNMVNHP